ncbi:YwiC-like family protein [Leptolyngbya sp. AN02str]|uniref:YwiC-like family protein n=1 Tax=Leptolyngbya sp. AN02str TaxID=3423363 RepID=UPI003D321B8C
MTSSSHSSITTLPAPKPNSRPWYHPTISPEHGVYVVLLVSFLLGAAAAVQWTWATTLALICAVCGFQAEHPLIVQLKQRRKAKPRLLFWGSLYAGVALAIALYLYWQQGEVLLPLLGIYIGAIAALGMDAVSVFYRQQRSILNELMTFFAVCLSAPFAYVVTTGTMSASVVGLWLLNGLFFSSSIFTLKLRKHKHHSIISSLVYHAIASFVILGLWAIGWLCSMVALTFGVALLKFGIILWRKDWYCTTKIQFVALLETTMSFLFLVMTALSLLPAYI